MIDKLAEIVNMDTSTLNRDGVERLASGRGSPWAICAWGRRGAPRHGLPGGASAIEAICRKVAALHGRQDDSPCPVEAVHSAARIRSPVAEGVRKEVSPRARPGWPIPGGAHEVLVLEG